MRTKEGSHYFHFKVFGMTRSGIEPATEANALELHQRCGLTFSEDVAIEDSTLIELIEWGLTPFLTISQLYHGGQFTYSCISWFSHTSTPHNNLPKQLAAFPQRLIPLVEDEWRMSHWLLSIVGKKVGRAGIRTHNPWIDSPRRYRLRYRGSACR